MSSPWNNDLSGTDSYLYRTVKGRNTTVLNAALDDWWDVLCTHAAEAEDWNVIVADIWIETGRLIGHVQREDQAVGFDRGTRVCLSFDFATGDLQKAEFSNAAYSKASTAVFRLLDRSLRRDAVEVRLKALRVSNDAKVWFCENGQLTAVPDLK